MRCVVPSRFRTFLVRNDAGARAARALVAADVVEMIVRVDEERDGPRAVRPRPALDGLGDLREAATDQEQPVPEDEHGDVSPKRR